MTRTAQVVGYELDLLLAVETANQRQKQVLYLKLTQAFDGRLDGKRIALWGLAFKPNTHGMRDAPICTLMESSWSTGRNVQVYDRDAMGECALICCKGKGLLLCRSLEEELIGTDALVICTALGSFRTIGPDWLKRTPNYPIVVDGRDLFDPMALSDAHIRYYAIGRGEQYF